MRVLIIGGGIGGLTAAIALRKAGVDPQVYERASALREVGAGIGLMANAVQALDALGLGGAIRALSLAGMQGGLRNSKGEALMEVPADEFSRQFGAMAVMHRAALLSALESELDAARLHLNHEFVRFDQEDHGVTAHFNGGGAQRGEVLIGADGLRSAVRAQLFGARAPRYAGYTAWRAVVPFEPLPLVTGETWGRGRRFGIVPMAGGRVYWFATANAREGERDPAGQTKSNLLRSFLGWHRPIEALIEAADESSILRNDIYDLDPLTAWTQGRVTLLGDAAHPMTPNLGQGACQAMEDAVVLAVCLKPAARPENGLAEYQRRRIPRTRAIVLQSRRFGQIAQWQSPFLCGLRDRAVRMTPRALAVRSLKDLVAYHPLSPGDRSLLG